jgi:hypothetical protein
MATNALTITSFNYENIGVNIDITPRTHHDDDVTRALKVEVSSISGVGFGGLPTFGNRQIMTHLRRLRHLRPEPLQPFDQPAIAPLHGFERSQPTLPVGGERRRDQRHPGSQIPTVEQPPREPPWPGHDDPVRIAEE